MWQNERRREEERRRLQSLFDPVDSSPRQEESPPTNFFGAIGKNLSDIGNAAGKVGEGVGNFFGGIVDSVVDSAQTAGKGVADVVGGFQAQADIDNLRKKREEHLKQFVGDEGKYLAEAEKFDKSHAKEREDADKRFKASQDVDPLATASATADTFLNVASVGVGGAAKAGLKQGEKLVRQAVGAAPATAVKGPMTNRQALGVIGTRAGEGAGFGASQAALANMRDNGENFDAGAVWQDALIGGSLGGALGGGLSAVLNKGVRQQLPAIAREAGQGAGNFLEARMPGYQPGFVRVPFGADDVKPTSADAVQAADVADNFLAEQVASYNRPEDLVNDITTRLWDENKVARGTELIDKSAPTEAHGSNMVRISNNSPFYQEYFHEFGKKPTKRDINDMVRQLVGDPKAKGEVPEILDGVAFSPDEAQHYRDVYAGLVDREVSLQRAAEAGPPAGIVQSDPVGALVGKPSVERLPRGAQGFTPARVVEARGNPAMDYTGAYADEKPSRLSEVMTDITGERPIPSVAANPTAPRPTADEWNKLILQGQTPAQPQLALPSGLPDPTAGPIRMTRAELRKAARKGELPEDYVINPKTGKEQLTAAPDGRVAPTKDFKGEFAVDDAREFLGGKEPMLTKTGKPRLHNGKPIPQELRDVIEAIDDSDIDTDALSKITSFQDPDQVIRVVTRALGGEDSKEAARLFDITARRRAQGAVNTREISQYRDWFNDMEGRYHFNGDETLAVNKFLSAEDPKVRAKALNEMEPELGARAQQFYSEIRPVLDELRAKYNTNAKAVGKTGDQLMGDRGENYFPVVFKQPSIAERVAGEAGGIIDPATLGIRDLKKTGFDPNTLSGTTTASTPTLPGTPRSFNQGFIGSEYTTPTVGYTGHAQARTAKGHDLSTLASPIEAVAKYVESVNTIANRIPVVDEYRQLQTVIKDVTEARGRNNLQALHGTLDSAVNALLGKTNVFDRAAASSPGGEKWLRASSFVARQAGRTQLLGSIRTVAAQTGQAPFIVAESGVGNTLKGIQMMFDKNFSNMADSSSYLTENFPANRNPYSAETVKKIVNKSSEIAGKPMDFVANLFARIAWAAQYQKGLARGLTYGSKEAMEFADRGAAKITADRTAGGRAAIYESRLWQPATQYTMDVNQIWQGSKDMIGNKNYKAFGGLLAATFAYNALYEQLLGDRLGADPIDAAMDAGGILFGNDILNEDGEPIGVGERLARAGGRMGGEIAEAMPAGNIVLGSLYPERGLRIPFSGGDRVLSRADVFGDSQVGRFGASTPIQGAFEAPATLLGIPGLNQAQRTVEGLSAYGAGESVSPSGQTRFDIDQNFINLLNAMVGGPYATAEGRAYLEERNRRLRGQGGSSSSTPPLLQRV